MPPTSERLPQHSAQALQHPHARPHAEAAARRLQRPAAAQALFARNAPAPDMHGTALLGRGALPCGHGMGYG